MLHLPWLQSFRLVFGLWQVFNFNDVPMGMVTLFIWTLGDWNDDIAVACLELADPWTVYKALKRLKGIKRRVKKS